MFWQVMDGFNHLKSTSSYFTQKKCLSKLVIDNVNREFVINAVLTNLQLGINADLVLKSHLEICRHLKIEQAAVFILEQIKLNRFEDYDAVDALGIYLELNNDKTPLFNLFTQTENYNNYLYVELVKVLKDEYKNEISQSLLTSIQLDHVNEERKIEIALLLIEMGIEPGLSYLVNNFVVEKELVEHTLSRGLSLKNINTEFALQEINKIIHHILDEDLPPHSRFTYTIKGFVIECITQFSIKSEEDLALVEQFLDETKIQFEKENKGTKEILFQMNRIVEKFRETETPSITIPKLKQILSTIT